MVLSSAHSPMTRWSKDLGQLAPDYSTTAHVPRAASKHFGAIRQSYFLEKRWPWSGLLFINDDEGRPGCRNASLPSNVAYDWDKNLGNDQLSLNNALSLGNYSIQKATWSANTSTELTAADSFSLTDKLMTDSNPTLSMYTSREKESEDPYRVLVHFRSLLSHPYIGFCQRKLQCNICISLTLRPFES